ncbi:hypothetical protein SCAR479_01150 [Seiridium cardinale]|uniref:Uncharacterized protein n=1 Tax=Seiridium cardinale TaxID=138064 RepID=A0ABR2Y7U9_9PEZI
MKSSTPLLQGKRWDVEETNFILRNQSTDQVVIYMARYLGRRTHREGVLKFHSLKVGVDVRFPFGTYVREAKCLPREPMWNEVSQDDRFLPLPEPCACVRDLPANWGP